MATPPSPPSAPTVPPVHPIQPPDSESWRVFRIMAEFVEGFETMSTIQGGVSIFGSARTPESHPVYANARECAAKLARLGHPVITGGGPGVMEAANRGAHEVGGISVGLNIALPFEQTPNPYQTVQLDFDFFFARKVMFVKYAKAFIIFPGGFGTMDELFESLTLIQTHKIKPFPVVCIDRKFWTGLFDWAKNTLADEYHTINPDDLDLVTLTDDIDEAVDLVHRCLTGQQHPPVPERFLTHLDSPESGEGTLRGKKSRRSSVNLDQPAI